MPLTLFGSGKTTAEPLVPFVLLSRRLGSNRYAVGLNRLKSCRLQVSKRNFNVDLVYRKHTHAPTRCRIFRLARPVCLGWCNCAFRNVPGRLYAARCVISSHIFIHDQRKRNVYAVCGIFFQESNLRDNETPVRNGSHRALPNSRNFEINFASDVRCYNLFPVICVLVKCVWRTLRRQDIFYPFCCACALLYLFSDLEEKLKDWLGRIVEELCDRNQ